MAYIIVLNPFILSGYVDGSENRIGGTTDLAQSKLPVAVGTAVVAGVMSILVGVVGNFPIALAAGLGSTPSSPAWPSPTRGRRSPTPT